MNLKLKVTSGGNTITKEDLDRITKGLWRVGYKSLFRYEGTHAEPSKPIKLLEVEIQTEFEE